ncbi:hypothetical protein JCM15519_24620 [Fundidesulfovibrio butyratiphilus]
MPTSVKAPRSRGLAFKLSLLTLACTAGIFLGAFAYSYHSSRQTILNDAAANAHNLTQAGIGRIRSTLASVEEVPGLLAASYAKSKPSRQTVLRDLTGFIFFNRAVYGACVAYDPGAYDRSEPYFSPYAFRKKDGVEYANLGKAYGYPSADWFLIPRELGTPQWSEPYFDEGGGGVVMSTYSVPFFHVENDKKTFLGVVTADLSLNWLRSLVGSIQVERTGYAFLLSRNGVFVSHPDQDRIMRESIFSMAEAAGDTALRRIGQDMIRGGQGFVRLPDFVTGRGAWLSYAPVPGTGWSMGLVLPEDELFEDLDRLGRQVAGIVFCGLGLLVVAVVAVSSGITRPLKALAGRTAQIARGDLDAPLPVNGSSDEVGQLARSFEEMRLALKDYIANLTETTKAKERMESELKIARTIQMSFLPKRFPPFPEIGRFDLHAELEPALEVGGDLFDFFLLADGRLLFLVGDVSGKGVPAALFMAVTKTLVKGIAEAESTPAAILARVNNELAVDNEALLFVTMFLGLFDFSTGELTYSNAGHNPPVLVRRGRAGLLDVPKGIFLGVMDDAPYADMRLTLEPEDSLLVYTDGVNEAMDAQGGFYGNDRLLRVAAGLGGRGARAVGEALMADVRVFAGEAPQADDITVLVLGFKG